MVDSIRFDVKGLRQLGEAMREMAGPAAKRVAGGATGAAGKLVKGAVKQIIRANSFDTGTLEEAVIVKKVPKSQLGGLTSAHMVTPRHRRTGRRGSKSRAKQTIAPHAMFVQFGTLNMPAEPYLDVGLQRNIGPATNAMRDKLASGIAREARKARKT